jgi:transcription antitermination factor NusG
MNGRVGAVPKHDRKRDLDTMQKHSRGAGYVDHVRSSTLKSSDGRSRVLNIGNECSILTARLVSMAITMFSSSANSNSEVRRHPWYALKVRSGGEAKVTLALDQKGYTTFLPTHVECRQYSDRIKKLDVALFPGYLFCRLDVNRRLPLLTTPGVESLVSLGGRPQAIEETQIDAIRCVVDSGAHAIPWPYLREGDEVTIKFGALAGLTGWLVRFRGSDRLVLSVHLLQRSICIEIDRSWIYPRFPHRPVVSHVVENQTVA